MQDSFDEKWVRQRAIDLYHKFIESSEFSEDDKKILEKLDDVVCRAILEGFEKKRKIYHEAAVARFSRAPSMLNHSDWRPHGSLGCIITLYLALAYEYPHLSSVSFLPPNQYIQSTLR